MRSYALRNPTDIGALIKARRKELGIGQVDLAKQIGASRLWVSQIEQGKPGAGIGLVLRALAALDIDLVGDIAGAKRDGGYSSQKSIITPDINDIVSQALKRRRE